MTFETMSNLRENDKKSRSIYCTTSEYSRLKDFLDLIRVYDSTPEIFRGDDTDGRILRKILTGSGKNN